MTRRFFPARTPQQIPAQNVDVGVTMTPLVDIPPVVAAQDPIEPPPPGGCDVTGVEWAIVPAIVDEGEGFGGMAIPSPELMDFGEWQGRAWFAMFPGEFESGYTLLGVPVGPEIGGVTWEPAWAIVPTKGESAVQSGPLLRVTIPPAVPDAGYENTLTAVAKCGTATVGTLRLTLNTAPPG